MRCVSSFWARLCPERVLMHVHVCWCSGWFAAVLELQCACVVGSGPVCIVVLAHLSICRFHRSIVVFWSCLCFFFWSRRVIVLLQINGFLCKRARPELLYFRCVIRQALRVLRAKTKVEGLPRAARCATHSSVGFCPNRPEVPSMGVDNFLGGLPTFRYALL